MHLVIYGPEGSGKGTQAKLLAGFLKLPILTAGDLVREAATFDKGKIGDACRKALTNGRYLPDEEMFFLLKNKLKGKMAREGFILDGFPRTLEQAKLLVEEVRKHHYQIDKFIYLAISDSETKKRLLKRGRKLFSASQISHDTASRIDRRLKIYHRQEKKILRFFREKNLLLKINGQSTKEKVFREILKGLKLR